MERAAREGGELNAVTHSVVVSVRRVERCCRLVVRRGRGHLSCLADPCGALGGG